MKDPGENMRKRSPKRATKYGVAALVSFSLIAAACGGSDDDSTDEPAGTEAEAPDDSASEATDDTTAEAPAETEPASTEIVEGELEIEEETDIGDPVAGGTLRYGLEADVDGLNPTSSALSAPGLMMANAVFDTLTAFDTDGVAVPYLAESVAPATEGDLLEVGRQDPRGHHLPRRHAGHDRRRPARDSRPRRRTRSSASPSSRSTPRRVPPSGSTTTPPSSTCSSPTPISPAH